MVLDGPKGIGVPLFEVGGFFTSWLTPRDEKVYIFFFLGGGLWLFRHQKCKFLHPYQPP